MTEKTEQNTKFKANSQLLIIIQSSICLLMIIATVVLKYIFPNLFPYAKNWYETKLNDSILSPAVQESFSGLYAQATHKGTDVANIYKNQALPGTAFKSSAMNNEYNTQDFKLAGLFLPLTGVLTSDFGKRVDPFSGKESEHWGIDIAAPKNSAILCALPGIVKEVSEDSSYGKHLIVKHDNNTETLYAHCNEIKVNTNDNVLGGQEIALVGSTGRSTGNHLHFELIMDGNRVNPLPYLPQMCV